MRVQLTIQMFIAGPTDESEEAEKQRERARRALYELAAKECDLMRDVIAQRLPAGDGQHQSQPAAQAAACRATRSTATMAYQITLK